MTPPPSSRLRIVAPVPRWQQIADHLRAQILSGRYPAGQPLPSEEALAAEFGVSRPTVRQGIATLTTEGLVTVRRPYGTIVRDPHARPGLIERRGLTDTPDGFTEPGPPAYTDIRAPVWRRRTCWTSNRVSRWPPGKSCNKPATAAHAGRYGFLCRSVWRPICTPRGGATGAYLPPPTCTPGWPTTDTGPPSPNTSAPGCPSATKPTPSTSLAGCRYWSSRA